MIIKCSENKKLFLIGAFSRENFRLVRVFLPKYTSMLIRPCVPCSGEYHGEIALNGYLVPD
jgi:hypothetical protein